MSSLGRTTFFEVLQTLKPDDAPVTITRYRSRRTGMMVVVVDQSSPQILGRIALATEIHDDSGVPHTLEHLCFMGSRGHSNKTGLDKLAARCYSRLNAFTETDMTDFQVYTAGWNGLARILPMYLEHILLPTLSDDAFYTEVHHVDGSGQDAGVVYAEMQGCQSTPSAITSRCLRRLMYPEGIGYRYDTGGLLENLRVLTVDQIRTFHKQMYRPQNLCLTLTGEINHPELLEILDIFEREILDIVPTIYAPFKRPWVNSEPPPPLRQTAVRRIQFPDSDESMGEIRVGYIGPDRNDPVAWHAGKILLQYLCGSSISILKNTLVEKEHLCSDIRHERDTRTRVELVFVLSSVKTSRLEDVEMRMQALLEETATKPLDIHYLQTCLKRDHNCAKRKWEDGLEYFAGLAIEDHLYGNRDGRDLDYAINFKAYDELERWSETTWRNIFCKWFTNAHHASALGEPSKTLSEETAYADETRAKARRQHLGNEGLRRLTEKLERAKLEHGDLLPDSYHEKFPPVNAKSIRFITTITAQAGRARMGELDNKIQTTVDQDDDSSSLFLHFEHIRSNFVQIVINICTASVPTLLKPMLELYLANFFETPVEIGGKRTEYQDVVKRLEMETVSFSKSLQVGSSEALPCIDWMPVLLISCWDVWKTTSQRSNVESKLRLESDTSNWINLALVSPVLSCERTRMLLQEAVSQRSTVVEWLNDALMCFVRDALVQSIDRSSKSRSLNSGTIYLFHVLSQYDVEV